MTTQFWLAFASSNASDDGLQGPYGTLSEAAEDRIASGQVVVDATGHIVSDDTWLWDWERATGPDSYAWRLIHGEGEPWRAKHRRFDTSNGVFSDPVLPPRFYKEV